MPARVPSPAARPSAAALAAAPEPPASRSSPACARRKRLSHDAARARCLCRSCSRGGGRRGRWRGAWRELPETSLGQFTSRADLAPVRRWSVCIAGVLEFEHPCCRHQVCRGANCSSQNWGASGDVKSAFSGVIISSSIRRQRHVKVAVIRLHSIATQAARGLCLYERSCSQLAEWH